MNPQTPSGFSFSTEDVAYLASAAGADALSEAAGLPLSDATLIADIAGLRARLGRWTSAVVQTVLLRRRASPRLDALAASSQWLLTDEALQQASAAPVALHRAGRLAAAGAAVHDVTCSIGTELAALAAAGCTRVIGSDLDRVRLAMARHNLARRNLTADRIGQPETGGPHTDVALVCADALHPVSRHTAVLVDPARRTGVRRVVHPTDYRPPLHELATVYAGRDLIVKCAPGIEFEQVRRLGFTGEIEVTSWRRSVREVCLWPPSLGETGVRRRATVLDRSEQITDAEPDDCGVGTVGRWIIDPDGAVVRAGLVRQYGVRHGLWQLDPDIAYLTGDHLPDGVRGFEVLDSLTYSEKRLRQALTAHDCGALEILVRGVGSVQADPDALRRRLRPRGTRPLTVVITRIGRKPASRVLAFVCCATSGTAR